VPREGSTEQAYVSQALEEGRVYTAWIIAEETLQIEAVRHIQGV
jgi:hypothetical protein